MRHIAGFTRLFCGNCIIALVVALHLHLCGIALRADDAPTTASKVPVPDIAAQKQANLAVDGVFKDQLAKARRPEDKSSLAKKMLASANETASTSPDKYVLLKRAIELAMQAADAQTAMDAALALGNAYDGDALKSKLDVLIALSKVSKAPKDQTLLADRAEEFTDEALAGERYELAKQAAELMQATARKSGDPLLVQESAERLKEVGETETAAGKAKASAAVLETDGNTPSANLVVGRFLCFVRGNWPDGLPKLALAGDPILTPLAQKELDRPSTPQAMIVLADAWWDEAKKLSTAQRLQVEQHAAKWYHEALPQVSGLAKSKVEMRLAAAAEESPRVAIQVAANQGWQRILAVKKGDVVSIKAEGSWCNSVNDRPACTTDADGLVHHALNNDFIPNTVYGSLIGQVGSQRFAVGRTARIHVSADGNLELRINDKGVDDNDGQLNVTVTIRRPVGKP